MSQKHRQYVFTAKAPFDAPYELTGEALYCEWDYNQTSGLVEGLVQYQNPRVTPTWPYTIARFEPATLQYFGPGYVSKQFSVGTPRLPSNISLPTIVPPPLTRYQEYMAKAKLDRQEESLELQKQYRKRKAEKLSLRKSFKRTAGADYHQRVARLEKERLASLEANKQSVQP